MLQVDSNGPSTRIEAIYDVFEVIEYECCVIYINYIIIYSTIYEEHIRDLKKVLERREVQKFYLKSSKY